MNHNLFGNIGKQLLMALLVCVLLVSGLATARAAPGDIERVSVDSSGNEGISFSFEAAISGDGRFVTFVSSASNLVSGDTNNDRDIFVHDRDTGETTRVSVDSSGNEANSGSFAPAISSDGRFVTFASAASNLVSGDTNGWSDIFVHDRDTGETTRVSVDSSGNEANHLSLPPAISGDGRFVAFPSVASNLVSGDTNGQFDIFVHDRDTGETTRVSLDSSGNQTNGNSLDLVISSDGRFVAFISAASNLVSGDTNGRDDVFVKELAVIDPNVASCDLNSGFNVIMGTNGSDNIDGTPGNDIIFGLGGNDYIEGKGGNDCIIGGAGHDKLFGDDGDDIIWGGEENNSIVYSSNDNDSIYGRAGNDILHGGGMDDRLEGNDGDDTLFGNGRRDKLYGNDGDDHLDGGDDIDALDGGEGNDTMIGGEGDDYLTGKDGDDDMFGNAGRDKLYGGDGDDTLNGGSEDDTLTANNGNDVLYGGSGKDRLDGGHGEDELYGEDGDDKLYAGRDDDLLDGGADNDYLDGSSGGDTCLNGENLRSCEL